MRRYFVATSALLLIAVALVAYRLVKECSDWQNRYKRFVYVEMTTHAPIIYTTRMIEEIAGGRPFACDRPGLTLTQSDLERFRQDAVESDEFIQEIRAAFRRTDGFKNL